MILLLCDLPKPLHGMSQINIQMRDLLIDAGVQFYCLNTVPSILSKFFGTSLWMVIKTIYSVYCFFLMVALLLRRRFTTVYRPINGGVGQVFDIMYLLAARVFKVQIIIHHHSFNYLNKKGLLFKFVISLLKESDRHIVLSDKMRSALIKMYDVPKGSVHVISNIAFFSGSACVAPFVGEVGKNNIVFGYLANITYDKGIVELIELYNALCNKIAGSKLLIAGNATDSEICAYIKKSCAENNSIDYIGPLYGVEKSSFFQSIDVFLYPSRNEAEPLVIYEAVKEGCFLCTTSHGCMSEQNAIFNGEIVDVDKGYDEFYLRLCKQIDGGALSLEQRKLRVLTFTAEQIKASQKLWTLLDWLKDGYVPESSAV